MDIVAILALMVLTISGVLTIEESLSGCSDPNVLLIATLFVVGNGIMQTGVAHILADKIIRFSRGGERVLLISIMCAVALLGSVMSSTGVVAIFVPIVLSIATTCRISANRLLMPLSVSALISGMLTLVATTPNLIVNSALARAGYQGFSFFDFTPIGLPILLIGILYMLSVRRYFSSHQVQQSEEYTRKRLSQLVKEYHLEGRAYRLEILSQSPLIGAQLKTSNLRSKYKITIVAIERPGHIFTELLSPHAHFELREGDILFVDTTPNILSKESIDCIFSELSLKEVPLQGSYFTDQSREVGMVEVIIPPESHMIGKTIIEAEFRRKFGLTLIGIRRKSKPLLGILSEEKIQSGDVLLLIGTWKYIKMLKNLTRDFVVIMIPAEIDEVAPAMSKAPYALAALCLMIFLMITGIFPHSISVLIVCLLLGVTRCISIDTAYQSIPIPIIVLIICMMPFAIALEKTGGNTLIAELFISSFSGAGPRILLIALFVVTSGIGLFISNTATAIIMAPIAIKIAEAIHVSPIPLAMTVAIASSTAFMTPVASPVNMLVMGPGQYSFSDFLKIGTPLSLIVLCICVVCIPFLFPF